MCPLARAIFLWHASCADAGTKMASRTLMLPGPFSQGVRLDEVSMFVAVYWWRVHPGKEDQFRKAWRRGTELITARYGSHGSRLHRDADGRFVAYAEWPDEATWRAAFEQKMAYDEPDTRAAFVDAIAEAPLAAEPIFTMTVTDDLLQLRLDAGV